MAKSTGSSSGVLRRLVKNPLFQRFLIWLAPIILRAIARRLTAGRSRTSGRKYVKNKTK